MNQVVLAEARRAPAVHTSAPRQPLNSSVDVLLDHLKVVTKPFRNTSLPFSVPKRGGPQDKLVGGIKGGASRAPSDCLPRPGL